MDTTINSEMVTFLRDHTVQLMILLDLIAIGFTAWVVRRGGGNLKVVLTAAGALVAWLVVLHTIISTQALLAADISGPAFLGVIFAGVGIFGAGIFLTPVGRTLMSLDQQTLSLAQGIRVYFGAGFLLQAGIGLLPIEFGIIDGFSHITAGFMALIAAALIGNAPTRLGPVIAANAFGLLDILVVASSIALILLPEMTPHHPMMYAVFLPAPIWLWLHVVSFAKIFRANEQTIEAA